MMPLVYPEYEWLPWKFYKLPNNYWDNIKNHRKFMDWAEKQLGIKEKSDWYKILLQVLLFINVSVLIMSKNLREIGGSKILIHYNLSLYNLLSSVYPEFDWVSWKFRNSSASNVQFNECKSFLESAAKELDIKEPKDWYNITAEVKYCC